MSIYILKKVIVKCDLCKKELETNVPDYKLYYQELAKKFAIKQGWELKDYKWICNNILGVNDGILIPAYFIICPECLKNY